jgi:hypothetical protein
MEHAMKDYVSLAIAAAVLFFLFWLTQRPLKEKRRPFTVAIARLLRRAARRLWIWGEALEIGFFHGRKVRDRISLDLDAGEEGGQR